MAKQTTSSSAVGNGQYRSDEHLSAFQRIGRQVYFYNPKTTETTNGTTKSTTTETVPEPDLIVVCSWMAAASRHISKYTTSYLSRFPSIPTLLIRSSQADIMLKREDKQLEEIRPAVTAVQSVFSSLNHPPRVLVHVFSNGGSWSACMLSAAYYKATGGQTLPITALVLDSCPSFPHMQMSHRALSAALPKFFIIRFVGSIVIWIFLCVFRIINEFHFTENLILKIRRLLNEPAGPFVKGGVPRVYICSKTDAMVPIEDVRKHADDAQSTFGQLGLEFGEVHRRVKFEEFEGSPHVGHLMIDKDRYWTAIQRVWEEGMRIYENRKS